VIISPEDIRNRARRLWATGQPLRAALAALAPESFANGVETVSLIHSGADVSAAESEHGAQPRAQSFFPYPIPFRKPTAQEWLDHFAGLREAVARLYSESKAVRGSGYSVEYREVAHQKLGRLRVPDRITFESIDDLAACAGETDALHRFRDLVEGLRVHEPRMLSWLSERPLAALAAEQLLPQLIGIAKHLRSNPRPNCYARELGIPGVDSKFIENNRVLVAEWLDRLLPAQVIDVTIRGFADHGFERRYGLRFEEPSVRFRWLDPSRAPAGLTDASVPLSQLSSYAPDCEHVIITENKTNFLTLPPNRNSLAIFGGGYGVELLGPIRWLANQPLHYWGDLDTHGFAIVSRLRLHFPHVQSFLMDRDTLMRHRELWTEELSATRVLHDLPALDSAEQSLYDDLRHDRLGDRVRLEQERVSYQLVEQAMADMCRVPG
jgi:hypothetical protein